MDEPKTLKSLEILAKQITNLNDTHHLSQVELSAKLNEWMLLQHNVAIRHISPYLNELRLNNEEQSAIERRKSNVSVAKLFESLKEDCEEFESVKQSVDSMHSVNSRLLFCSSAADPAELNNPRFDGKTQSQFNNLVAAMNNQFVSKEVKKMIRFKFGFLKIIENQVQSLEAQIRNLKSQFELISLIPEAFDRESLRESTISIENHARQIVNQSKSRSDDSRSDAAPKHSRNAPDSAKFAMFRDQDDDVESNNESLYKDDDDDDDDLQKLQQAATGPELEFVDATSRQRKTSTFLENSDELDSSNDSIERHAAPDPHLNNISRHLSNLELSKLKYSADFAKDNQEFDYIQLADTLNASDLYQNAALAQLPLERRPENE